MSLVTTAMLYRCCNSRLSRSTRAVLPLPTGPATPTRNARFMCLPERRLEQEIPLRQRQHARRLAGKQFTVGANLVGFRIHFELWRGGIVDHVFLPDVAAVFHGDSSFGQTDLHGHPGLKRS